MYFYFRHIRSIGRIRAWSAAKVDRIGWNEEKYPPPPKMRRPDPLLFVGSWAEITPSYRRVNRPSSARGKMIETQEKARRLRARRNARKHRAYQKRTGK
jgi:hypothetical protein